MNCGSSGGTIENPARLRISAAHMAATTGVDGAAVADCARVTVRNKENPGWGKPGFWGSTIEQGECDRSSRDGNTASTRFVHRLVSDVQKMSHALFRSGDRLQAGPRPERTRGRVAGGTSIPLHPPIQNPST